MGTNWSPGWVALSTLITELRFPPLPSGANNNHLAEETGVSQTPSVHWNHPEVLLDTLPGSTPRVSESVGLG